eukprot:377338-Pleurochrysis_carterae.AAC.1
MASLKVTSSPSLRNASSGLVSYAPPTTPSALASSCLPSCAVSFPPDVGENNRATLAWLRE